MDQSHIFQIVFLIFELALFAALLYVPYKIVQAVIRSIARTTYKTVEVIINKK